MENNKRNDFIDVYILKTLNEIKNKVTWNIKLDKKRMEETDKKMSVLLKELIDSNFKNLQRDSKGNLIYTLLPIVDEKENEKVRLSLVLYYTALYYDNVELLHELLKADISFERNYSIHLQYLDKTISSKFDMKDYIDKIKTCGYIIKNFAKSIENLSDEEKEKYATRFARLFKLKYEDIKNYINNAKGWGNDSLANLFNKGNLDTFEDTTYEKATQEQLRLIDFCNGRKYEEDTCKRLNNLMQNENYSNKLCDFDLMMELYTDEQLTTLDYDISYFLSIYSKNEEILQKAIEFVQMRPDLVRRATFISKEKFMKIKNHILIEALEHMEKKCILRTDHNIELLAKTMAPKATLKKAFGAYNKRNS